VENNTDFTIVDSEFYRILNQFSYRSSKKWNLLHEKEVSCMMAMTAF